MPTAGPAPSSSRRRTTRPPRRGRRACPSRRLPVSPTGRRLAVSLRLRFGHFDFHPVSILKAKSVPQSMLTRYLDKRAGVGAFAGFIAVGAENDRGKIE